MSNSSKPTGFRNIPAPQGSKANSAYNRFIPREELGDFASWKPGSLGDGGNAGPGGVKGANTPAPQAAPAEPTTEEWRARVQAARQSGYQDGYRDGLVALEGFKQSFAQQATQQIGTLLEAFDQQLDQLDGEVAAAVSAAAVALARQVLRAELQTRPELVAEVAAQAVNAVMLSARHITVQVHPLDLPMVAEGAEEALAARGARLLPDASLARGGVLVQSDIGAVDARIAGRWAQAAAAMGSNLPWEDKDT